MKLVRVNRQHPCPICQKDHYCSVTDDGQAAYCTRVQSDQPSRNGEGWWHRLTVPAAVNGAAYHRPRQTGVESRYAAHDAATGAVVGYHVRLDFPDQPKRMWWEDPDGRKKLGRDPQSLALYGVELLADVPAGRPVIVTEGEKKAEALRRLGVPTVGTMTGADGCPCDAALRPLVGYDVCLWPDNDAKGRAHMEAVATRLVRLGGSPRLLTWPDAPEKGDAADFVAAGHGLEDLDALYAAAEVVTRESGGGSPDTPLSSSSSSLRNNRDDDDENRIVTRLEASTASLGALTERYKAETVWLAEGYIALAELTMVVGAPESMKSWLMADLARAVHTGHLWLGSIQVPQGKVVYFEQERARNFVYQTGLIAAGWRQNLDGITTVEPCGIDICDPSWQRAITAMIERERPSLVVFNSYRAVFRGRPPDSADVALALGWLGHLAERQVCAVVVVDATNKAGAVGTLRGMAAHGDSIQKAFEADTILHVERKRDKVGRGTGPARVYIGKQRYASEAVAPFVFDLVASSSSRLSLSDDDDDDRAPEGVRALWLDQTTLDAEALAPAVKATVRVMRVLPTGGTLAVAELAKATGLTLGSVKNALTQLKDTGQADNPERGRWCRAQSSSSSSPIPRDDDDDEHRQEPERWTA